MQKQNSIKLQIIKNAKSFLSHFDISEDSEHRTVERAPKNEVPTFDRHVTVLVPIGLPGIGKTTLHEKVLSKYFKDKDSFEYRAI